MELESVKATLETARADVDAERDRTDSLDRKLTNVAAPNLHPTERSPHATHDHILVNGAFALPQFAHTAAS